MAGSEACKCPAGLGQLRACCAAMLRCRSSPAGATPHCCFSAALLRLLYPSLPPPPAPSYDWIDEDTIVAAIVPPGLGAPPRKPITPLGPKIEASIQPDCHFWRQLIAWAQPHSSALAQVHSPASAWLPQDNSDGRKSQARTYPDLLQGPYDEHLFDYYCQSQLVTVKVRCLQVACRAWRPHALCVDVVALGVLAWPPWSCIGVRGCSTIQLLCKGPFRCQSLCRCRASLQVSTGEVKHIGPTRLYTATSASPDGRYLLVSWVRERGSCCRGWRRGGQHCRRAGLAGWEAHLYYFIASRSRCCSTPQLLEEAWCTRDAAAPRLLRPLADPSSWRKWHPTCSPTTHSRTHSPHLCSWSVPIPTPCPAAASPSASSCGHGGPTAALQSCPYPAHVACMSCCLRRPGWRTAMVTLWSTQWHQLWHNMRQ